MFKILRERLKEIILTKDLGNKDGLQYWREKIYYSLSLTLVILGLIAYIPSAIACIYNNLWEVLAIDTLVYLLVLSLYFYKKISYHSRVYGLLIIIYFLGVSLLILLGPFGAGWIWLFAFPVFGSILKGFRTALFAIVINLLTVVILGILIHLHKLDPLLIATYNPESWMIIGINFCCLSALVSIPIAVLLKALELTLEGEQEAKQLLEQERQNLSVINKDLSRTNKDLDNFIYTASHDLKSPITNIEGLVTILQDEVKALGRKDLNEVIGLVLISVNRFKTTIQSLAEVTKVQRYEGEEPEEILSVHDILEDVKFNLRGLIDQIQPHIQEDLKERTVKFSRKNFTSILYNLISNAIKYHEPSRKAEVHVTTEKSEDLFVLTIQDNGLGMRTDYQEKIFKMFKRMHDHVEGSGVGLYIIKRIVENNGGKIEVESELGVGTVFRIYLKV